MRGARLDGGEARGLEPLRCDLGEDLGGGEARGECEAELGIKLAFYAERDLGVREPERAPKAGEVGEALVDALRLHVRRVAPHDGKEAFGEYGVGLVVGGENDGVGAELAYFK